MIIDEEEVGQEDDDGSEGDFSAKDSDDESDSERDFNSDSESSETKKKAWKKNGPKAPKGAKLHEVEKIVAESSVKVCSFHHIFNTNPSPNMTFIGC